MRRSIVFLAALCVCLSTLFAIAQTPPQWAALQKVPYFGVNLSGPEFAPWNGQTFPSAADWAYLGSLRVPYVRLPIAWESLQTTLGAGSLNATYLANIKSAIASANKYGIKVIVDVHNFAAYCAQADWTSSGCGYAGNGGVAGTGVSFFNSGITTANFSQFWGLVATALAGTPGLAGYELMNEPSINMPFGTNLVSSPNGFGNGIGTYAWFATNGGVVTQLANGTNPLGAGYGPAWALNGGTGFGSILQSDTLSAIPYIGSIWVETNSGTQTVSLNIGGTNPSTNTFTANTSWSRHSFANIPTAGSNLNGPTVFTASAVVNVANMQIEAAPTDAVFTGTIATTVLNVSAVTSGTIHVGDIINGTGITCCTTIASNGTGSGGTGTYNLNQSETVSSGETITAYSTTPSTYAPNPLIPFVQAAVTEIRSIDTVTPIYINGFAAGTAYPWQNINWELDTVVGSNISFDAHQYFDGAVSAGGGGGTYSSNYTSYSTSLTAGAQLIQPFISWLRQTNNRGFIGEFGIPNSNTDGNANWFLVANGMLASSRAAGIQATMWFYGANGVQAANNLNIARSGGKTDPRMNMLSQWR
jgi:aryl-phospho-beta-D-glucosidase BglC (GH1 family)